jgi:hypothetical protein
VSYSKKTRVSEARLRQIFAAQLEAKINAGQYTTNPISEKNPDKNKDFPIGTKSTLFEILNERGERIGTAHAYVLPDGSLGASGRLDPKSILVGNTLHILGAPETKTGNKT